MFGLVLAVKICLLVKLFNAAVQFKFSLIAFATLILNVVKLWVSIKHKHNHSKVIHFEQAHHDHHYDDDFDVDSSGPAHEYWSRSDNVYKGRSNIDDFYWLKYPYGYKRSWST